MHRDLMQLIVILLAALAWWQFAERPSRTALKRALNATIPVLRLS